MSLNITPIVNTINTALANVSIQACSATKYIDAANNLNAITIPSVATEADLPCYANNQGRFMFVESIGDYRYADKLGWTRDYGTVLTGSLWSWGDNSNGQLGDGTTTSKSSPVSVIGGFTDWCQVSAGEAHVLAVKMDGTLWAWGSGSAGKLGDNSASGKCSPISVVGGFTDWCWTSAGSAGTIVAHSAAIRTNGSIWLWGAANYGKLGDLTTVNKSSPVSVVGGFTDWCRIASGNHHMLATRTNGSMWGWGRNQDGQLGDGTTVNKSSPVSVIGGFTDWCWVAAGQGVTSFGIRTDGTLWAWGNGNTGRLGNGTIVDKSSPVSVLGGFTDWHQVNSGNDHGVGLRTNGSIWTWGSNADGQLGDGTTVDKSSPVSVLGGFTDWCWTTAGNSLSVGIRTNGTIWAWGCGSLGRLGDGCTVNRSSPVSVIGGFTDWCQVSATNSATAIRSNSKGF